MQSEIDYNRGWNDVMRRLATMVGNPEAIEKYYRTINVALLDVKTHYARGAFAALKTYQEEILAPEMAVA